jgi:hypothetical protein
MGARPTLAGTGEVGTDVSAGCGGKQIVDRTMVIVMMVVEHHWFSSRR